MKSLILGLMAFASMNASASSDSFKFKCYDKIYTSTHVERGSLVLTANIDTEGTLTDITVDNQVVLEGPIHRQLKMSFNKPFHHFYNFETEISLSNSFRDEPFTGINTDNPRSLADVIPGMGGINMYFNPRTSAQSGNVLLCDIVE